MGRFELVSLSSCRSHTAQSANEGLQLTLQTAVPTVLPEGPNVFIQEAQDVVFILDNNDRGFPIEIAAWLPKMNENHKRDVVRLALVIKQVH